MVVKCGASGHNIRSRPSLKAAPVGMLAHGNAVTVQEYVSLDTHRVVYRRRSRERLSKKIFVHSSPAAKVLGYGSMTNRCPSTASTAAEWPRARPGPSPLINTA